MAFCLGAQVMDMLLKSQAEGTEMTDDDPQLSYMISAWARICKILGKQFQPYLPVVMGPVLKAASMKPEVALLDSDDLKSVEGSLFFIQKKMDLSLQFHLPFFYYDTSMEDSLFR